jgi:hypothetical protein
MIPTGLSAQMGGAVSPGVHVGGAVNPGATVRGAVERGIPGPDLGTWRTLDLREVRAAKLSSEIRSTCGGLSYRRQLERPRLVSVFFSMSSDRVIIDAIKTAQDLLSQNLAPTRNLTDAATVMRLRELIRSQAIRSALERSSDTVLAFGLRAVEQVISDQSRTNHETINRLWDVLDDPHLNKALGLPQNSRKPFRSSGF